MAHLASARWPCGTLQGGKGRMERRKTLAKASEGSLKAQDDEVKLVLYSKPECSLCDGMKAKVEAVLDAAQYTGSVLAGMGLEVRDTSTNESWWELHGSSVPVLCLAVANREEEIRLPKPAVRLNASRLGKRIEEQINGQLQNQ